MPWLALTLLTTFLVVVFPARAEVRRRRYGDTGRVDRRHPRPRAWVIDDALFLLGFSSVVAGTALDALDVVNARSGSGTVAHASGVLLLVGATALAVWAQETMGPAWRADIPPLGGSRVVTGGPFRVVRNPNYVAMLAAGLGAVLLVPSAVTVAGWLVLLVSLLLTARAEEPLLAARFGAEYHAYAARVGRFVPGIGRLRP